MGKQTALCKQEEVEKSHGISHNGNSKFQEIKL